MPDTIILLALIIFAGLAFLHFKKPRQESDQLMLKMVQDLRREMQESQNRMTQMLQQSHQSSSLTLQKQFKQSSDIVQEVTKNLSALQETNRQVVGFAEQMKTLENILKNPKQRGILGEYALETLLSNHLHKNYEMQYKMPNGEIVDAAIFFNEKIIPIDSKFSLENYNRMSQENDDVARKQLEKNFLSDVKKRIDETAKYIRPEDGTTEFAFMFVPAEGVHYNLTIYSVGSGNVNTRNLMEYAFEKRVIIVSPSSFFAYLQTVLQGLKALDSNPQGHWSSG